KTRKHQGKTEKCVRIVFIGLHNYARKRCAIGFDRTKLRTGQKDKLSHPENGKRARNLFELNEALSTK
ncbi:hypothetical protein UXR83_24360, partial [Escherichia coli]|nr:hypothetical protein [Escherichia coli]